MENQLDKYSLETLMVLLDRTREETQASFQEALESEKIEREIEAEIARRGLVGVAQNDAAEGEPVTVAYPVGEGRIIDISTHLPKSAPPTPEPVVIVPDSNEPACEGGAQHDWERIRNGPEVILDACRRCPQRRWVEITEEGGTLSWNYGSPPPPKQRARVMQEDEELDPEEEWVDADGNVPRNITGRQRGPTRITDGRRVEVDP